MRNLFKSNAAVSLALIFVAPLATMAQTTVFSDTFNNGSTVNVTPGTPTENSTGYIIAAGKNAPAPSMSAGNYSFGLPSTSGSVVETQARFASSPVALTSVGDYISLIVVFTDTSGILAASGTSATLNVGLFNSGGVNPITGIDQSGLSAATTLNRGGARLWQGYMGRAFQNGGGASGLYVRNQQNSVTDGTGNDNNGNQDLLFNGAVTGSYKNPTGAALGTQASTLALTAGNQYTISYSLTLSAASQITATYNVFGGNGTNSVALWSESANATGTNVVATSFDGLAIGWRYAGLTGDPASTMDVNSITVIDGLTPVPEPTTFVLLGLGSLGFVLNHRRRMHR